MVLYGLNENLRSYKSLKKGANFRLSPALSDVTTAVSASVTDTRTNTQSYSKKSAFTDGKYNTENI